MATAASEGIDLATTTAFRLGPLLVEPSLRAITTTNRETLEPRVMKVLVALVRADGAVLSRDALIDQCWDGQIVGDDAIQRAVGRLRRLADEHGDGTFRIETVPRVGYRLVGTALPLIAEPPPAGAASDAPLRATGAAGVAEVGPASAPRRAAFRIAGAAAVVAATGGAWWLARPDQASPAVQFTGYRTVGAVPPALPEAIAAATRSAFTADGLVGVTTAPAPFRLSGTLDRTGEGDAAVVRLAAQIDTASGTTLWAHTYERPVTSADGAKWFASRTTGIARCGASRLAASVPMSDDALRLIFAECAEESEAEPPFKGLDLARRLTALTPNLGSSWSTRADRAIGASMMVPPAEAPAQRAEAAMASDKALALDPQDARAWDVRAWLQPRTDFAGQERAFLAAVHGHASDFGPAFVHYGQFLIGVGRAGEARRWLARGHDVAPLDPRPLAALGRLNAQEGRLAEARGNFADLDALAAGPQATGRTIVSNALWTRDYARAAEIVAAQLPSGAPAIQETTVAGFHALANGDASAKHAAAIAFDAQTAGCKCSGTFNARMLAALGAPDAALRQLAAIAAVNPDVAIEAVSQDPVFAGVRHLPGFAPIAARLGLVAYWRAMKVRPGFCAEANAPPVCRTI